MPVCGLEGCPVPLPLSNWKKTEWSIPIHLYVELDATRWSQREPSVQEMRHHYWLIHWWPRDALLAGHLGNANERKCCESRSMTKYGIPIRSTGSPKIPASGKPKRYIVLL
jgi:hypothetical protein